MEKILIVICFLLISLISVPEYNNVVAKETTQVSLNEKGDTLGQNNSTAGANIAETLAGNIEYALPYPGILPDHPLFVLKKLRDFILDKLIVDPIRKAEFYLLQSDKYLNMTIFLLEKGKSSYARITVERSVEFMEKAVNLLVQLKDSNKPVPEYVRDRIAKSSEKHIEVLSELSEKSQGDLKDAFSVALETFTSLHIKVVSLK